MEDTVNSNRYCWLKMPEGKFSNSWNQDEHDKYITKNVLKEAENTGWKLIQYACLNDTDFEFYNMMRLK
jgi:hypothetical protein